MPLPLIWMNKNFKIDKTLKHGCIDTCPGCAHKRMNYSDSLLQKQRWLKNKLSPRVDKLEPIETVEPEMRWNYRGKVCLSTEWGPAGWKMGLISHEKVIPIHDCPVHTEMVRQAVSLFSQHLPPGSVFPMVYYVQSQTQVTLVLKSKTIPELAWLNVNFKEQLNQIGIKGLWIHLHPSAGRKVFSKNSWHLLYGSPRSVAKDGSIYGPKLFQQLIPSLYEQALDRAEEILNPAPDDCVIDLYCGIGNGLTRWARRSCHTIGVELDGEAVECARQNVPAATVLRGKCKDRIPQLSEWFKMTSSRNNQRLLYVNPPRTGLEPEVLDWITKTYRPDRMAYLSCSAGTLQRDIDRLTAAGYTIIKITPYDFFPQTLHVETLVFFQS
ncbi:MAG: class I SAM-dependent RNA methyltransferase [Dissulfuribacterales bacterium]